MGNLGKFKKKVKKNNADIIILDEKTKALLTRLSINYGSLLEDKEYDKASSMLNWAIHHQETITLEAIEIMNVIMAEALNINYKSLPQETRLSFFLDNPHHIEEFFSLPSSPGDLLEKDSQEYRDLEKSLSHENEILLHEYLMKVGRSKNF